MNMADAEKVGISLFKQIKLMKELSKIDDSYGPMLKELLKKQEEFFSIGWEPSSLQMYLEAFEEEILKQKN